MDLLQGAIDLGVIAGIIGLTQAIKTIDKAKKFEKWYILIPVIFGLGAAVPLSSPLSVALVARNGISYAGVAALAYMMRKKLTIAGAPIEETAGPDGPVAGQ